MNILSVSRLFVKRLSWLALAVPLLFSAAQNTSAESISSLLEKAGQASRWWNYNLALDYCNKAIAIDTNNYYVYMVRALTYEQLGRFHDAEMDFDTGISLAKDNSSLSEAYEERGSFFASITNTEKAVDDFSKVIEINPKFQLAYVWRGKLYGLQKHYDRSIVDCNMAILLKPDAPEAYYYKAAAYSSMQDWDRAIATYTQALEHDTNRAWIFGGRAGAFYEKKSYSQAITDYDKLFDLQPMDSGNLSSRGLCKAYSGDFRDGIEDCQKSIQLDTNSAIADNNLAWLLAIAPKPNLRDGPKAVDYAKKACELTLWKNAYCLGTLAAAYAESGNYTNAVEWEKKCISAGMPDKDMGQARKELKLFEHKKPYHWTNKSD
jgi:tetratricopeptide (TPR) repeat protein